MRNPGTCVVLWILALVAAIPLRAQPAEPLTLVRAGRLLDPRSGHVLAPAAVLVEGNKIKQVGTPAQVDVPPGGRIIDLGGATLLPGLIDSHTHLFLDIIVPPEREQERHINGLFAPGMLLAIVESPTKRALMGARLAREDLESGVTTVRNLGHSGIDGDTELRDAIDAGRVSGPRVLASGRKLITRGDYVQNLNPALADAILQQEFLLIDGADLAREAVRRNEFQNVDVETLVKLGHAGMPPLEVLRAITSSAAEMLGWADRIGTVESGKFADLVAVAGDPIADLQELERVGFVMKDGHVVRNVLVCH